MKKKISFNKKTGKPFDYDTKIWDTPCKVCGEQFKGKGGLHIHFNRKHKLSSKIKEAARRRIIAC